MRAVEKSLLLTACLSLGGVAIAEAREGRRAPIEYARQAERPADAGRMRLAEAQPAAARRASPASLDLPEMLYGYGRAIPRSERPALDLRGRLGPASGQALLEDAAFDEPPAVMAQASETEGETASPATLASASPAEALVDPPVAVASTPVQAAYFVQVGAFADPANADRVRTTLEDVGLVTIDQRQTPRATLHRVRLGQWATRQEAELALDKVASRGFSGALVAGGP